MRKQQRRYCGENTKDMVCTLGMWRNDGTCSNSSTGIIEMMVCMEIKDWIME